MTTTDPTLELIIIRGLPGTGKSYRAVHDYPHHLHYEPDLYCCDARGRYRFDLQFWSECQRMCQIMTDFALARRESVVVTDVFLKRAEMVPYHQLARTHGARFCVFTTKGEGVTGTHRVPFFVLQKMREEFEREGPDSE